MSKSVEPPKVTMSLIDALRLVEYALQQGNLPGALGVVRDLIKGIEEHDTDK